MKRNRYLSALEVSGGMIMKYLRTAIGYGAKFFAQYPAVLSGYIIYSYLFVSIARLFFKAKDYGATISDAYDIFSALPFMWLLAVSLVKVIDVQKKLYIREKELEIKNTQLSTMHEVVKGLQHQVNTPLAIISLSIDQAKRAVGDNPAAITKIESIEDATSKITDALQTLSAAEQYNVQVAEPIVGTLMTIPKEHLKEEPLKVKEESSAVLDTCRSVEKPRGENKTDINRKG
jgi:hypothetical protein